MTAGLKRYHNSGCTHFITFSCFQRRALFTPKVAVLFEEELEHVRQWYGLRIYGYVVMPEHVHLLVSEPERSTLSVAIQVLKQTVSRKSNHGSSVKFWQSRYYDFLVKDEATLIEKLRYLHRNPVKRELCTRPEDWPWSSFRHHAEGLEGVVEIESQWTARKRERAGQPLKVRSGPFMHGE